MTRQRRRKCELCGENAEWHYGIIINNGEAEPAFYEIYKGRRKTHVLVCDKCKRYIEIITSIQKMQKG